MRKINKNSQWKQKLKIWWSQKRKTSKKLSRVFMDLKKGDKNLKIEHIN